MHVLTVEVHTRFKAQGIAGTETDRGNTRTDQIIEERWRLIGRQDDFQSIFAGITGARDEPVAVGLSFKGFEVLDQRATGLGDQFCNLVPGLWALNRQHRQLGALVQLHLELTELRLHPDHVLITGSGVDHQPVTRLGAIDNHVVVHPAALIEHGAVQRTAGAVQTLDIIGQQMLKPGLGLGATDVNHGHVGYIENPAITSHLMVLFDLRAVMQRHIPTAKIDHLRA